PDDSTLKLYHRKQASVEVKPISESIDKVRLDSVTLPEKTPPGVPVPVTYKWSGSWKQLQSGLVLLSWHHDKDKIASESNSKSWLHDHGIGMGKLNSGALNPNQFSNSYQVIERTAMLPSLDVAVGNYQLSATYLNRETGETYPIAMPPVSLEIDPIATIPAAPELDLVTQLRTSAVGLSKGLEGLEPIFAQTARINQYDPVQDYLIQVEQALEYRLNKGLGIGTTQHRNWAYALTLSRVLQQDIKGAIAAIKQLIELDSENPYPYAYLAFIHLYDWNPTAAEKALKPAIELKPNLPEIQALRGITALMQGRFIKAWHNLSNLEIGS
ncbi:MAG: phospholipid carrier-dependent glycosyltransferase, partial [Moorea sp. SIO2B7]|nr:phospholipid carrier-dependent glycosyltransferase [Moorena sp. SIO2B7]